MTEGRRILKFLTGKGFHRSDDRTDDKSLRDFLDHLFGRDEEFFYQSQPEAYIAPASIFGVKDKKYVTFFRTKRDREFNEDTEKETKRSWGDLGFGAMAGFLIGFLSTMYVVGRERESDRTIRENTTTPPATAITATHEFLDLDENGRYDCNRVVYEGTSEGKPYREVFAVSPLPKEYTREEIIDTRNSLWCGLEQRFLETEESPSDN